MSAPQQETYTQKQTRINRRLDELDTIRQERFLTLEEVKEYFALPRELEYQAGSSEEKEEVESGRPTHRVVNPDEVATWTGARFCQRTRKIELIPPPTTGVAQHFSEWRQRFRRSSLQFRPEVDLPSHTR